MESQDSDLAGELRNALRPIWRRLMSDRTLSMSRLSVLNLLRQGPLTAADLARREHVSPQAMTGILKTLETEGYIARERLGDDRRRIFLNLTDAGREVIQGSLSTRQDWLADSIRTDLNDFDRDDLRRAINVLEKLGALGAWPT